MLEVRLLGVFEIKADEKPVNLTSRAAQSLFAFLALNAGTAYRREKLAGQLWPESTEEQARDYLRHALWRIRKTLQSASAAPYLRTDDLTISLDASSRFWLDAAALRNVSEAAPADELMSVLSAYKGELLPGFYDEWVVLERENLQAEFERKMGCLLERLQEAGRWPEILSWAERWIALGQKPEAAYRGLMSAHAASGDMARVAAVYDRCAKSLAEFGVEPSDQTTQLLEQIKAGKTSGTASQGEVPILVPARPASNIPVPLTSFIGREKELSEILRVVKVSRLTTLTGPGGVGKTRLAIQSAARLASRFDGGVFWVGLDGLSDPNLVVQEIAHSLQVHEVPMEPLLQTVTSHLSLRASLLVLDNCEHLIRTCAHVAEQLLAACPKLSILATSIEALGLFSETVWQVPSLPLPEANDVRSASKLAQYASVGLFVARASSVQPDFVLSEGNATPVVQICQRLDGIPLAIELAAARIKVLSVHEIAARLDDRFSLLTSGSRTAIPRHQTLRATIAWSHELLSPSERILFRRLSVFASGFTLAAAEAVCSGSDVAPAQVLDELGRLADKSLVTVEASVGATETRYRLLETIRQYALEQLLAVGEAYQMRQRHAEFYVHMAEESEPNMYGRESAVWFARLDRDLDNLRMAIDWSTSSGHAELALRILGAIVYFWFAHGLVGSEWNDRVEAALAQPDGQQRTLARAKALNGMGFMYWADIYPTDKRADFEEALAIGMELNDQWNVAVALRNLGLHQNIQGRYDEARSYLERSIALWEQMGPAHRMGLANTLIFLGEVAFNQNSNEWAGELFEQAARILRGPGDMNFLAYATRRQAHLAWLAGDFPKAVTQCAESLRLNEAASDPRGIIACVAGFGAIALAQGQYERAAVLLAATEAQAEASRIKLLYIDRMEYERNTAAIQAKLNAKVLAKLWAKGRALSYEAAIALAAQGE